MNNDLNKINLVNAPNLDCSCSDSTDSNFSRIFIEKYRLKTSSPMKKLYFHDYGIINKFKQYLNGYDEILEKVICEIIKPLSQNNDVNNLGFNVEEEYRKRDRELSITIGNFLKEWSGLKHVSIAFCNAENSNINFKVFFDYDRSGWTNGVKSNILSPLDFSFNQNKLIWKNTNEIKNIRMIVFIPVKLMQILWNSFKIKDYKDGDNFSSKSELVKSMVKELKTTILFSLLKDRIREMYTGQIINLLSMSINTNTDMLQIDKIDDRYEYFINKNQMIFKNFRLLDDESNGIPLIKSYINNMNSASIINLTTDILYDTLFNIPHSHYESLVKNTDMSHFLNFPTGHYRLSYVADIKDLNYLKGTNNFNYAKYLASALISKRAIMTLLTNEFVLKKISTNISRLKKICDNLFRKLESNVLSGTRSIYNNKVCMSIITETMELAESFNGLCDRNINNFYNLLNKKVEIYTIDNTIDNTDDYATLN